MGSYSDDNDIDWPSITLTSDNGIVLSKEEMEQFSLLCKPHQFVKSNVSVENNDAQNVHSTQQQFQQTTLDDDPITNDDIDWPSVTLTSDNGVVVSTEEMEHFVSLCKPYQFTPSVPNTNNHHHHHHNHQQHKDKQ